MTAKTERRELEWLTLEQRPGSVALRRLHMN